jgi:hypothetical protein
VRNILFVHEPMKCAVVLIAAPRHSRINRRSQVSSNPLSAAAYGKLDHSSSIVSFLVIATDSARPELTALGAR